jgi:predicted permease
VRIASSKPAAEAAFDPRTAGSMFLSVVRPAYFASIGIDLVGGRDFNDADARGGLPVAIVSESFAKRSWPNESAIGQRIALGDEKAPYLTIIGVARDAVMSDVSQRGETVVYVPQRQHAEIKSLTLIVRSTGDAGQLASALRREIRALDPALPVYGVETLAQFRDASLAKVRNASGALALCGALALTLAAIGIYGVMSFAVGRRRREIGIRVALGALHVEVVALFLRQGLRLTAAGLAIGLGLSLVVTRLLSAMLLGVTPTDMLTFVAVAALLGIVAQLAVWIPARRAARVDPMEALRQE